VESPSGTVTFLFTDVEGSTRLWQEHPDVMQVALARHDEILRDAIESHAGHVVKMTGDGIHAVFPTAHDALDAAVVMQLALAAESFGETGPLRVRMGVHTCEVQYRDGDYYGSEVNRAARLMSVAHGGQIVVSAVTSGLLRDTDVVLVDLGEHRLRDLAVAERVFQVGDGVFPPLRSVDAVPTNLPTVRTKLIGRTDDVRALSELVARERLLTLTGVGGVGKTRLALGVAAAVAAEFADGCWMVELAPVAGGDDVVTAVAAAMRAPTADLDALAAYLADRRVLIVLDNCEHVLDAAAELVDVVLGDAADVHVVVTSREPLGLDGEQVRRVQSLGVPDAEADPDAARSTAAVRLFAERAGAVADGFTIDADNVAAVVEICRHLDGIPLAIELAAARVGAMPPVEIARRLDERFRLLAGGSRRAQERHRTLLATVSWSHDLLSEPEQLVFRRLSVFPASFELAAAEAVAVGVDVDVDVVECVLRLVNRSLVVYEPDAGRYRLLETLRQYGADRLTEVGETEEVRQRHARWFLALAERVGPGLDDAGFAAARAALAVELENVRATADWCVEAGWWAELAGMCRHVWWFVDQDAPVDGAAWFQQVVDHGSLLDPQIVADSLGMLAWLYGAVLGDTDRAIALAERSLSLADAEGLAASSWAWQAIAQAAYITVRNADALHAAERAVSAAEARDDEAAAVSAMTFEHLACIALGELERGAAVAAGALRRAQRTGHPTRISGAMISLCSGYIWAVAEPDFAAGCDTLTRHGVGLRSGEVNDMWIDLLWAATLLGLDRPGAVGYLVRVARTADRHNSPAALDFALRYLAIAAAENGLAREAAALVAYTEARLRPYRMGQPGDAWIQARLDRALAGFPKEPPSPGPHRGEIMTLVNHLEATLTRGAPVSPSTTD